MQDNPNNFDEEDDAFFDDVLEDNYEDEFEDGDDFQEFDEDAEGFGDEGESDEWASQDDFDGADPNEFAPESEKKKFKIDFRDNKVIIGIAVLVGFGVFIFQLTGKKSTGPQPGEQFQSSVYLTGASDGIIFGDEKITKEDQQNSNQAENLPAENGNGAEQPEDNSTNEGFLFNPDSLEDVDVSLDDTPPMPTPINSDGEDGDTLTPMPEANQVPRSPVISQEDENEYLIFDDMEADNNKQEMADQAAPVQEMQDNSAQIQQSQTVEQPSPRSDVSDNIDGGINQKLDMILSRIEKIELELSDVKERQAPDFEDIHENIRTLEEKVASLSKARPSPPKVVTPKSAPSSAAASPPSRPRSAPAPQWELKAAQPGKAWVAQKGKSDIRPVMVGEELSGIGRIRSISFDGSRWVIEGDSGRIFQ